MNEELEMRLQKDFPFMKRNISEDERNIYRRFGCECAGGWYQLINDLCQAITDIYAEAEVSVDIVIVQIKEKFGSLRFYYSFEDSPNQLHALDFLGSTSLRIYPNNDKTKKKLRHDIAEIVRSCEEKSSTICESCGYEGVIRMDMRWKQTLCDDCYYKYQKKLEERQKK